MHGSVNTMLGRLSASSNMKCVPKMQQKSRDGLSICRWIGDRNDPDANNKPPLFA